MTDPLQHEEQLLSYSSANVAMESSEHDPFVSRRYLQFAAHLPKHSEVVLDVGCSTGEGGEAIKRCHPNVSLVGLDCVASRIAALDPTVYRQGVVDLSMSLPFPDCSFDAIVAGEFIEHLYPRDVDATIHEFHRVLRLRGRLIMTTPNPGDLKRRLRGESVLGGAHLSQHEIHSMRLRLRAAGFSRVRTRGSGMTSRYLGPWPFALNLFGSYLVRADKW